MAESSGELESNLEPKTTSPGNYTLVEAAQYGALSRCIELVEEKGESVTKSDSEDITVLHWGAINNRLEIASYFIQKGADVNAVGGELRGAPLHWATRQGHLSMVILLMRYGANPYIMDAEGLNCLHIAAQLGFTDIMAYLIGREIDINVRDVNGMTPLMHSAARSYNADPTRLLVHLEASVAVMDNEGQSALHHAVLGNNSTSTKILLDANAPVDGTSRAGKTPLNIAQEQRNKYILQLLTFAQERQMQSTLSQILLHNPRVSWWLMFLVPSLFFLLYGLLGVYCSRWYFYLFGFFSLTFALQLIIRKYIPVNPTLPLPLGLVFATKFWLFYSAFTIIIPHGIITHLWLFSFMSVLTLFCYWKTATSNPGFIPKAASIASAKRTILELCEKGQFHTSKFCTTCLVQRPLRSKHCYVCKRCVTKFDHHCMWTYNCVGWYNHHFFLAYLVTLLWMLLWGIMCCFSAMFLTCSPPDSPSRWSRMMYYAGCKPWITWILINCILHFVWVNLLFMSQILQIFVQGSTTNEKMNAFRYQHFRKLDGSSPFNRGLLQNFTDFFGLTCCTSPPTDWMKSFAVGQEDNNTQLSPAMIPLPYSNKTA